MRTVILITVLLLSACAVAPTTQVQPTSDATFAELDRINAELIAECTAEGRQTADWCARTYNQITLETKQNIIAKREAAQPAAPGAGSYPRTSRAVVTQNPNVFGTPVIRAEDCIGAVVADVCHGTPTPRAEIEIETGLAPRCYGQMIGGRCTGPMF